MGLLGWLTSRIGRDLDERVHGSSGVARDRFQAADDTAELIVRARLGGDHAGSVTIRARAGEADGPAPVEQGGASAVTASLGAAKPWRGGEINVTAHVSGPADAAALAVLTVEVLQPEAGVPAAPPLAFQTYSVEGRFDASGHARLELGVTIV
jgi:hypothetical protein